MPHFPTRRQAGLLALACLLAGCATPVPQGLALSAPQQSAVAAAQDYLNGLDRFEARFIQSGAYGEGSGFLWVDRPGMLRIAYLGPKARVMVANGPSFVIYDPATDATTSMATARTPLGLLLAPHIALSGNVVITDFRDDGAVLSLTLADSTHPGQGALAVRLQKSPMLLTGIVATDTHGRTLAMTLGDLNRHPVLTPDLFRLPGHPIGT